MKKRIAALLLALLLLASTAAAYPPQVQKTADALHYLSLFKGTGKGYELNAALTRAQGITLLVRLVGAEKTAEALPYTAPFTDVPDWAKPHVNYAYLNGITNGVSATAFAPNRTMTDAMFLTLVLRAMGYSDLGPSPLFTWDAPHKVAREVGLVADTAPDASFLRGDAVTVFWNALTGNLADGSGTMAHRLIARGVFTEELFRDAAYIREEGILPVQPEIPEEPEIPAQPEEPVTMTYEKYIAMSFEEKQAFRATFASTADFFAWYNQALKEYESRPPQLEMGPDGVIDLGGLDGNS